jgi:23S rRNA (cytosine1962-C5)-methyltransferase
VTEPRVFISDKWKDYELIDAGNGRRLERWGGYILDRPDPQALWPCHNPAAWGKADAVYHRGNHGGGSWEYRRKLPEEWKIRYGELTFKVRPTGFKHTGLFPEQAYNWDKIGDIIARAEKPVKVINLFGYTGAATVAAAHAGADVCHVDSARGMLGWCKENAALSGIPEERIRLIPEDCMKFVLREAKRAKTYDAVMMDPPSFGRGAKGEVWKLETDLMPLLSACVKILSEKPLFFLINSYTAGISPIVAANMLMSLNLPFNNISYGELALTTGGGKRLLPCGLTVLGS